jgi:mono/diheme cytochrome c family protein
MSRLIFIFAALTAVAHADPGLILRFGETDARVVRQAALYVPDGQAPSAYSAPGQVKATFEGVLTLEARSRLVFTLEGTGEAALSIDDEVLCDAIGKPSESERLGSGEHAIKIDYTGPAEGASRLRLFWQGRDFGREPVPASVFSHNASDALLSNKSQLRYGHQLTEQHRCASCHGDQSSTGAASLAGAVTRFETAWLTRWIADPKAHRAAARMPKLFGGEDAIQKAADIADFLAPPEQAPPGPALGITEDLVKTGGHLFHEQGCIGCHTLDAKGDAERIGLGALAGKYRHFALAAFLREPSKHHADTRMPHFGFDEPESIALEVFLRSIDTTQTPAAVKGNRKRGEQLFKKSGCINCHSSELKTELAAAKPLADLASADCKAADFSLSEPEQTAITAALAAPKPHRVPAEFAAHQFTNLRCAACHQRDDQPAYRERFAAEVEHLKPPEPPADDEKPGAHAAEIPRLDHLGLKLRPEWRTSLFKGEITPKTRHWLPARMPAFPSRAAELSTGISHAAGLPATSPAAEAVDPDQVKVGAELTGLTGLSCGACHAIGDKPAFAVFEGEGTNFRDAGARLRAEYFHLWMNDPQRQWPGTIMPKYATDGQTPLTQHYDGDAAKQFEAIRHYLQSLSE